MRYSEYWLNRWCLLDVCSKIRCEKKLVHSFAAYGRQSMSFWSIIRWLKEHSGTATGVGQKSFTTTSRYRRCQSGRPLAISSTWITSTDAAVFTTSDGVTLRSRPSASRCSSTETRLTCSRTSATSTTYTRTKAAADSSRGFDHLKEVSIKEVNAR